MKLKPKGSVARIALRALGMLLNAATYALAARKLSAVDMGIWAMATALTTITLSLDLGLASTLRNRLAARPGDAAERDTFNEAFDLCVGIAATYGLVVMAAGTLAVLIGYPGAGTWTPLRQTIATTLSLCFALILVRMPFNLAANAFYSYSEPDIPVFWEVFNFIVSFGLVAMVLALNGHAPSAAGAFLAGGTLTGLACTWQFLRRRGWTLTWRWPRDARRWLTASGNFAVLQVVSLGLSAAPGFLVASMVRVEEVTVARASMILCQAILSLHLAHAMPLWTEVTQLRVSVDRSARLRTLEQRLRRESLLLALAFGALAVFLPFAISAWINRHADPQVTTAFCVWGLGYGLCNLFSLALNGAGKPLMTAAALVPGTAVAAAMAWWLAPTLGSLGVAAGFAAGGLLSAALMVFQALRVMNSFRVDSSTTP